MATALSALRRAFGSIPRVTLQLLDGGASGAFPFRADVGGRQCLVRVEGASSPLRNPRQYESMAIAAAGGIAPALHHVDEAERVAILDFVEARPLAADPGGRAALATASSELLTQLQATPPFPPFMTYPDIVQRLWAHVCRTGLFAPGALDPHTERPDRIRAGLHRQAVGAVSSHGAPVPRNILFDGRRLWLIDWESACANDPLVDAAIMLDNLAPTPELEGLFLAAWLGRVPGEDLRGRLAAGRLRPSASDRPGTTRAGSGGDQARPRQDVPRGLRNRCHPAGIGCGNVSAGRNYGATGGQRLAACTTASIRTMSAVTS